MVKRYGTLILTLLLGMSILSGCGNDEITGEWYSLDEPESIYFSLKSDGTVEVFDKDDYHKGEYTVENNQLCMHFGGMANGCGAITTIDGVNVIDVGGLFAYGKENAQKLHKAGITKEDIEKEVTSK